MPDQNKGSIDALFVEYSVHLARIRLRVMRPGSQIAPSDPRAVKSANPRDTSDLRLHPVPIRHRVERCAKEHNRRAACSNAVEVKTVTSHVNKMARGRI